MPQIFLSYGLATICFTLFINSITSLTMFSAAGGVDKTNSNEYQLSKIVKGTRISCGIDGKRIYVMEERSKEWKLENTLTFNLRDIELYNDTLAVVYNEDGLDVMYSLKSHKLWYKLPELPINTFVRHPVIKFAITSYAQRCFYGRYTTINYSLSADSVFVANEYEEGPDIKSLQKRKYLGEVKFGILVAMLNNINKYPNGVPGKSSFLLNENGEGGLNSRFSYIFFVNDVNDTLYVTKEAGSKDPWTLSWNVLYKGVRFYCNDIDFSTLIYNTMPDDFVTKKGYEKNPFVRDTKQE